MRMLDGVLRLGCAVACGASAGRLRAWVAFSSDAGAGMRVTREYGRYGERDVGKQR